MTNDEITIAIAESQGWQKRVSMDEHDKTIHWCLYDSKGNCIATGLPNYPSDLNAMHEVEKTLNESEQDSFIIKLKELASPGLDDWQWDFNKIHATAQQRAEAYLRVKGLWKE